MVVATRGSLPKIKDDTSRGAAAFYRTFLHLFCSLHLTETQENQAMRNERVGITTLMQEFNQPHKTLMQWLQDAGIPRATKDKTFPHDAAAAAIRLRTDATATLRERLTTSAPTKLGDDEARLALIESKRQFAAEQTRKLKLSNDRVEAALLDRETVAATGRDVIARARVAFLAIGAKLAPRLAGETDVKKIAATIEEEARAALSALADLDMIALECTHDR